MEGYTRGTNPDVNWWIRQLRLALAFRKESTFEGKHERWRNMVRGEWQKGVLPSNIFFKMLRTTVPRIYFRNPSVSIQSLKPGMEGFILAKLMERVDNKLLKKMKVKQHMKRIVQSAWMYGTGVGKLGFGSQFHATPETLTETEAPLASKGRESIEYNFDIMRNMPWFMMASTDTYLVPAGTRFAETARWDAFLIRRPIHDVKVDRRFRNTGDLQPTSRAFSLHEHGVGVNLAKPVDMVDLFEIRDKKTGRVFVLSPHMTDKVLLNQEDEFQALGIDVASHLIFNEDDERFWGIPDTQILEPLQLELNEIRTFIMYHRRISILKILAKKGAISPEQVRKILSADVQAVAWVDAGNLDDAIKILQGGGIPPDLIQAEVSLLQDVRETVGFGRNEFGEFKPGSKSPTATEAQIVKAASEIRVDERRDMVADMLVKLINDINPIIFRHWTEEQVQEISGPLGIPVWIRFRPSMMRRAQFEVNVDPDTSIPQTKDLREAKAMGLYERLKSNPLIDPIRLTQYLLHELHGVAFDDMLRAFPQGAGSQQNPLSVGQFGQFMQTIGREAPQLLSAPSVTGQ